MSEKPNQLFESAKAAAENVKAMAASLFKDMASDIGAEACRMGTQGTMELASALFNGHGFAPYGPGQCHPDPGASPDGHEATQPEQDQGRQRGGMER